MRIKRVESVTGGKGSLETVRSLWDYFEMSVFRK
jgi:hypothetical protein